MATDDCSNWVPLATSLVEEGRASGDDGLLVERVACALREAHEAGLLEAHGARGIMLAMVAERDAALLGMAEANEKASVAQGVAADLLTLIPMAPEAIEVMSHELERLRDENAKLAALAADREVDLRRAHEDGVLEGRQQVCREVEAARRLEVDDE